MTLWEDLGRRWRHEKPQWVHTHNEWHQGAVDQVLKRVWYEDMKYSFCVEWHRSKHYSRILFWVNCPLNLWSLKGIKGVEGAEKNVWNEQRGGEDIRGCQTVTRKSQFSTKLNRNLAAVFLKGHGRILCYLCTVIPHPLRSQTEERRLPILPLDQRWVNLLYSCRVSCDQKRKIRDGYHKEISSSTSSKITFLTCNPTTISAV